MSADGRENPSTPGVARRGVVLKRMLGVWLDRAKMHDHIFMIGVAIVIGLACGYGAVGLRLLIEWLQELFWGVDEPGLEALMMQVPWKRLLVPALGALIVGPIIYFFAKEAKGHGVPEVMAAVALKDGHIRPRVAIAKAVASALTIASGGSAGREGPIIQIGAAIGSAVGQIVRVSRRRLRTFVGCGAAAGIAATFNAPIAGALFSVEVILGEFGVAQFSPIVISSVLATVISRQHLGDAPIFAVPRYELAGAFELIPYMVLGVLCGLVASAFIKMLYAVEDRFDDLKAVHAALQPMMGGLLLGAIGLFTPHVYGDGYQSINMALTNDMAWWLLLILLFAKMIATSCTLGSGGSGGVFAPSLFLGAMAGGFLGKVAAAIFGGGIGAAGGYALVGMGGVVAGTTFAPISAILIIFEITYDYQIILPLMTVCIISTVVSSRISKESIYTMKLVRRGIDIFRGRSLDVLKSLQVSSCVRSDVETMRAETPIREVMQRMVDSDQTQFYTTNDSGKLEGVIILTNLRRILIQRDGLEHVLLAEDVANEGVTCCEPSESLSQALLKFESSGLTELPVVDDATTHILIGVIRYRDVVSLYNQEIVKLDMASGLVARVTSADYHQRIKLIEGFYISEWEPPPAFWGVTLADARLPARFNVRVILVKKTVSDEKHTDVEPVIPGAEYIIEKGDVFILCGKDDDLARIQMAQS